MSSLTHEFLAGQSSGAIAPRPHDPFTLRFVDRIFSLGAPPSVISLVRALSRICSKFGKAETYARQTTFAKEAGIGKSTVRTSLHWLEAHDLVGRRKIMVEGEKRELISCPWLGPLYGKTGEARTVGAIAPESAPSRRFLLPMDGPIAPKSAPNNSIQLKTEGEETTTTPRERVHTREAERLLSSSSEVSREEEETRTEPNPKAADPVEVVDPVEARPPAELVKPDDAMEAHQDDDRGDVAEDGQPPPAAPRGEPPGPDHRRCLHDWIKGLCLDRGPHAELVLLVKEMVAMLAATRPVEGTTFDPHEQIRLALENAAEVEASGKLKGSIGIYARGTIKKRIGPEGFAPLEDPPARARAKAGPDLAAEAEAGRKRKAEEDARIEAEKSALEARWGSLPDSRKREIEAEVRAEDAFLAGNKWFFHAKCLERMDLPPVELAAPVESVPAVELASPPPVEPAAPTPPPSADRAEAMELSKASQLARLDALFPARIQAARVEPSPVVEPDPIRAVEVGPPARPGIFRRVKAMVASLGIL